MVGIVSLCSCKGVLSCFYFITLWLLVLPDCYIVTRVFPIKSYSQYCISKALIRTFFVRLVVKHVCQTHKELACWLLHCPSLKRTHMSIVWSVWGKSSRSGGSRAHFWSMPPHFFGLGRGCCSFCLCIVGDWERSSHDYKTYEELLKVLTHAEVRLKLDQPQEQETSKHSKLQ